jgi:hypothetical protein
MLNNEIPCKLINVVKDFDNINTGQYETLKFNNKINYNPYL